MFQKWHVSFFLVVSSLLLPGRLCLKYWPQGRGQVYQYFWHQPANFGPTKFNVSGIIKPMIPIASGCTLDPLNQTEIDKKPLDGCLALVVRDNCSFAEKVYNAQQLGAVGVVVGNSKTDDNKWVLMDGKKKYKHKIDIPSVLILNENYSHLLNLTQTKEENNGSLFAMLDTDYALETPLDLLQNMKLLGWLLLIVPSIWCSVIVIVAVKRCLATYYGKFRRTRQLTHIPIVVFNRHAVHSETDNDSDTEEEDYAEDDTVHIAVFGHETEGQRLPETVEGEKDAVETKSIDVVIGSSISSTLTKRKSSTTGSGVTKTKVKTKSGGYTELIHVDSSEDRMLEAVDSELLGVEGSGVALKSGLPQAIGGSLLLASTPPDVVAMESKSPFLDSTGTLQLDAEDIRDRVESSSGHLHDIDNGGGGKMAGIISGLKGKWQKTRRAFASRQSAAGGSSDGGPLLRSMFSSSARNSEERQPQNDACAICLEDFDFGDEVKLLPCNHGFHSYCIDPWLSQSSELCPMCKQSIFMAPL